MRRLKKRLFILFIILLTILIISFVFWGKIRTRIASQIKLSIEQMLYSNFELKIYAKKIDFSIIKGLYADDFFITDKSGKLIFKAASASVFPDYIELLKNRKLIIDRLWISKGDGFLDLSKGNNKDLPKISALKKNIKHIILTDLKLNVDVADTKEKKKRLKFEKGFVELFISEKKIEGLLREHDIYGNNIKLLFYGLDDWGINGSFDIKSIADYKFIVNRYLKQGISNPDGELNGKIGVAISKTGKYSWNIDGKAKDLSINYNDILFNKINGNFKLSDNHILSSIKGHFLNTDFSGALSGKLDKLKFKLKSNNLYFPDVKRLLGFTKKVPKIAGIGQVNASGILNDLKLEEVKATVEVNALEIQNYDIRSGVFGVKYSKNTLKILKSYFIFGDIWDTSLTGEIRVGNKIEPMLSFDATNNLISGMSWKGTIKKYGEKLLVDNDISYLGNDINAVLDISNLPKFKGFINTKNIKADWEGINYVQKMEWLALVHCELYFDVLKQHLNSNFSLRRNKDKNYYIKNGTVRNDYGSGDFTGIFTFQKNDFSLKWVGNPKLFNIPLPLDVGTVEINANLFGSLTSPKLHVNVKKKDGSVNVDLDTDFSKYSINGSILSMDLAGKFISSSKKWDVKINSNKNTDIPEMILERLKKYSLSADNFVGSISASGKGYNLPDIIGFDLNIYNASYLENKFMSVAMKGNLKDNMLSLDKLRLVSESGGEIYSDTPTLIDIKKKKIDASILIKDYNYSKSNFRGILNGRLSFSNLTDIAGNIDLTGKEIEISGNKFKTSTLTARFSEGKFILNELSLPYPAFASFSGTGEYELKDKSFSIENLKISNNSFKLSGSTNINRQETKINNLEVVLKAAKDGKKLISYLQKGNSISGSFDIDSEYLKKLLSFDKIPPIRLNGNIINNKGKMDFKIKNGSSNINGECHFLIKKDKKNWFLNADIDIEDSIFYMAKAEKIDFDTLDFSPFKFNINVKLGTKVWLKSQFINVELGGGIRVIGKNYPGISIGGEIKFSRGTINYFNNGFDLVTGKVFYQSLSGENKKKNKPKEKKIKIDSSNGFRADYVYKGKEHEIVIRDTENIIKGETNIYLSVLASKKINGIDVYLQISGPISDLSILLYSSPELPQDKLKELVQGSALGTLASDNEFNDKAIMNALKINLADQLMGKVGQNIARGLDLQEFDIHSSGSDGESNNYEIRLGKYLSNRFYVRYYKKIKEYEDQQQYEIKYRTNRYLFLEGLYDEYKQDYRLGLQYNISF